MARLFDHGELREYLNGRLSSAMTKIERISEDELLAESVDSLVERFTREAHCDRVNLDTGSWAGGDVQEGSVDVAGDDRRGTGSTRRLRTTRVTAEFAWQGNRDLFLYQPTTYLATEFQGDVREGIVAVTYERPGDATPPEVVRQGVGEAIGRIATMLGHANNDVDLYNASVEPAIRTAVEARRERLLKRRDLRGALGFPLSRRDEAPRTVPVERRVLGPLRREARPRASRTYADEWALDQADYEDVITVITGMLRACERTPSVVGAKDEESLRDLVLIVLNGTYQGMATGETFVASGKTDILVRVEDRHVFVGECKWWDGEKALLAAVDQLLGYLPWRDEKAALLIFINRKDASAVIVKADEAIRRHPAFKREGRSGHDPQARRDYVLAHPDDSEREIAVAVLFAVIRGDDAKPDRPT